MEIFHTRLIPTEKSTIGEYRIESSHVCWVIEDKDRLLYDSMPLDQITKSKVHSLTAIPYGRYEIIISRSVRFSASASKAAGHTVDIYLPELLNVKGFAGVRIHAGNKPEDTEGCHLPGLTKGVDLVGSSRDAMAIIFPKIELTLKTEKVYLNITKGY